MVAHKVLISDNATTYVRAKLDNNIKDPFSYFDLMPKLHTPGLLGPPTRPVSSDYTPIPYPIGMWADKTLHPITQSQPTYFPNSFPLKRMLMVIKGTTQ